LRANGRVHFAHYGYATAEVGALKVVLPFVFLPPQMGQISFMLLMIFFWFDSLTRKYPTMARKR
jgi:hypothetical protein